MVAFDLRSNTPQQRACIEAAIDKCDFDFDRLLPRLRAETGRQAVPVTWDDLSRFNAMTAMTVGANLVREPAPQTREHNGEDHPEPAIGENMRRATLGLAYYNGRISIERTLVNNPALAEIVFLSEAAHMVDFFVITPQHRARIYELFHEPGDVPHDHGWFEETGNMNYWSWVGEAWMNGFIYAFTKLRPSWGSMQHRLTEDDAREVRQLLGAQTPDPPEPLAEPAPPVPEPGPIPTPEPAPTPETEPTPEPEPPAREPYFAAESSYAFHDSHKGISRHRTFADRESAEASGLTPCKVCKPLRGT